MRMVLLAGVLLLAAAACGSSSSADTAGVLSTAPMETPIAPGATSDVNATACVRFDIHPCTAAEYRKCGPGSPLVTTSACNGGPRQVHDLAPPGVKPGTAQCSLVSSGLTAQVVQYGGGRTAALRGCTAMGQQLAGVSWAVQIKPPAVLGFVCALEAPGQASAIEIRADTSQGPIAAHYCSGLATAGWVPPR